MTNEQSSPFVIDFRVGKAIFLVIMALMLCFSFPLTIFAAVPMGIFFLSFERKTTYAMFAGALSFVVFATVMGIIGVPLAGMFLFFSGFGFLCAEIMRRDIHPVKGMYFVGGFALLLLLFLWFGIVLTGSSLEKTVHQVVIQSIEIVKADQGEAIKKATSAEALKLKEMIDNPKLITQEILFWLPAGSVIASFFIAWITMFLLLKNAFYWRGMVDYKFKIDELVKYRAPELFVYPLIIALALALGSDALGVGKQGEIIAFNTLYSLGIFYFFHGVGIYLDFLSFMKIFGLMRVVLVGLTVFLGARMLVIVGVFDLWVNFRKFFKKKDKEGDIS